MWMTRMIFCRYDGFDEKYVMDHLNFDEVIVCLTHAETPKGLSSEHLSKI